MLLEEDDKKEEEPVAEDPYALVGSRGAEYGGECDLLYDQFELKSVVAKQHQIILLNVRNGFPICAAYFLCSNAIEMFAKYKGDLQ